MQFIENLLVTMIGVGIAVVAADYFLIQRSTKKAIKVITNSPEFQSLKESFDQIKPFLEWAGSEETQQKLKQSVNGFHSFLVKIDPTLTETPEDKPESPPSPLSSKGSAASEDSAPERRPDQSSP